MLKTHTHTHHVPVRLDWLPWSRGRIIFLNFIFDNDNSGPHCLIGLIELFLDRITYQRENVLSRFSHSGGIDVFFLLQMFVARTKQKCKVSVMCGVCVRLCL